MRILVTGGTGNVGGAVVRELHKRRLKVRVLARTQPEAGKLPAGVEVAIGDLLDPVSVEQALQGVDKLFLLNGVVTDELTQALIVYGVAKRIGLQHVTYLSVFKVEQFRDVPHFASKLAVENALREFGVPYTILRPGYYMQNDITLKDALMSEGIYPMPIGTAGIATVDIRDIAEAAAISLSEDGHVGQTYDLVASAMVRAVSQILWTEKIARCGFPWEKTTKRPVASVYTNCETALAAQGTPRCGASSWARRSSTRATTSTNGSKPCAPLCLVGVHTICA
jgi:uncharacterized protein YbjT (DUF2867 family)